MINKSNKNCLFYLDMFFANTELPVFWFWSYNWGFIVSADSFVLIVVYFNSSIPFISAFIIAYYLLSINHIYVSNISIANTIMIIVYSFSSVLGVFTLVMIYILISSCRILNVKVEIVGFGWSFVFCCICKLIYSISIYCSWFFGQNIEWV